MRQKSDAAYRTISEASEILAIPAHTLRHWETLFAPLKPLRRNGGRRFYRPNDLKLLAGIKRLIDDEGYSVSGVKKILREKGVGHVAMLGDVDTPPPASSDLVTLPRETFAEIIREVETIKNELKALRQHAGL
ncbi:MAG: MerR family transcriptional regulator [Parvularcula sp.]